MVERRTKHLDVEVRRGERRLILVELRHRRRVQAAAAVSSTVRVATAPVLLVLLRGAGGGRRHLCCHRTRQVLARRLSQRVLKLLHAHGRGWRRGATRAIAEAAAAVVVDEGRELVGALDLDTPLQRARAPRRRRDDTCRGGRLRVGARRSLLLEPPLLLEHEPLRRPW